MEIDQQELYKFIGSTDSRLQAIESSIKGFGARVGELEGRLANHIEKSSYERISKKDYLNGHKPIIISTGAASAITGLLMYIFQHWKGN